jgi:hypothetical protein
MPTVILLDSSLSMSRLATPNPNPNSPIELSSSGEEMELRHLAAFGITHLLQQIESNCKLEYVALIQFSSICELIAPFTRDMDQIRSKLSVSCQDKSSLEVGIQGLVGLVQDEWGSGTPITLIIVTDGGVGFGAYSLENLVSGQPTELRLPLPFPLSISVACLMDGGGGGATETTKTTYQALFNKLGLAPNEGSYHTVDGSLNIKSTEGMFGEIAALHYNQWIGTLELGSEMSCKIQVCPPPKPYNKAEDFSLVKRELSSTLIVKGFLSQADISSPPVYSKHLILPVATNKEGKEGKEKEKEVKEGKDGKEKEKDGKEEETKIPNNCVFLHGALKVENMCALVEVGEDWFGFIYSWSDTKKKSSLMLSLLEPGAAAIPWLGSINRLGPANDLNETLNSPFPVKSDRKPSYSSCPVVWIKQSGIQSDIQKVLRHARKLPEKTQHFYKELNRLKRAAVCLGFYELLEGVAQICERECGLLPPNVSPDCAIQLTYVAQVLRSHECYSVNHTILPRVTNFNAGKI